MKMHQTLLLALALAALVAGANADDAPRTVEGDADPIHGDYRHVPTACDVGDCISGGCRFERCTTPVSCTGGLCVFKRCKTAVCEGGLCVFDGTESPSCPGGACRFTNVARTLTDDGCKGGACSLDGAAHPSKPSDTLSA